MTRTYYGAPIPLSKGPHPDPLADAFPQPGWNPGGKPCGECHIHEAAIAGKDVEMERILNENERLRAVIDDLRARLSDWDCRRAKTMGTAMTDPKTTERKDCIDALDAIGLLTKEQAHFVLASIVTCELIDMSLFWRLIDPMSDPKTTGRTARD